MQKRTFILHWKSGNPKTQQVSGYGVTQTEALANACNNAGIGGGAIAALDYWEEITPPNPNNSNADMRAKLAGYLLSLYWTGAGDAGSDTAIFNFHNCIGVDEASPNHPKNILKNGLGCEIVHEGKKITQSDYFMILSDKLLAELGIGNKGG